MFGLTATGQDSFETDLLQFPVTTENLKLAHTKRCIKSYQIFKMWETTYMRLKKKCDQDRTPHTNRFLSQTTWGRFGWSLGDFPLRWGLFLIGYCFIPCDNLQSVRTSGFPPNNRISDCKFSTSWIFTIWDQCDPMCFFEQIQTLLTQLTPQENLVK